MTLIVTWSSPFAEGVRRVNLNRAAAILAKWVQGHSRLREGGSISVRVSHM